MSTTAWIVLGLVAGFSSPRVSQVIMRLADVIMSFPSLLIAVIVLYILGSSILNLMMVLAITRIPVYLRTTRAEVLEIRERMFVQAARVMGASSKRILFRHILANSLAPLLVLHDGPADQAPDDRPGNRVARIGAHRLGLTQRKRGHHTCGCNCLKFHCKSP